MPVGYNFGDLNGTNTIYKPYNVDFGLIVFEDSNDYLLIGKLNHESKDILSFSQKNQNLSCHNVWVVPMIEDY